METLILQIRAIVNEQLTQIKNPLIKSALENIAIEPSLHTRIWDYGTSGEEFECWTIAKDDSTDTSIIYCKAGFGPEYPWGLVFSSKLCFGLDSGWFAHLKDCFLDSWAASNIPTWFIEKNIDSNQVEIIAENLTSDEAFSIIRNITKQNNEYHVKARK